MTLIDEFTRECLAIRVARRINSMGVIEAMADATIVHGVPEHIRSDNGPEMTAKIVRKWLILRNTRCRRQNLSRRSVTQWIKPGKVQPVWMRAITTTKNAAARIAAKLKRKRSTLFDIGLTATSSTYKKVVLPKH